MFKDYLVVSDEQSTYIYDKILSGFTYDDFDVVIKKHPNDTYSSFDGFILSKYPNVQIINSRISGEELVATYKPSIIIGGFSTVVISSYFIFEIPVISYSGIYLQNKLVSSMNEQRIRFFMNQLGDYIPFCQNIDDVCKTINQKY